MPKIMPGQGRSDSPGTADLKKCMAYPGGSPQLVLLSLEYRVTLGIASAEEHKDGLHEVSPDDSRESSGDGEHCGDGEQDDDADVEPLVCVLAKRLLDEQRPGKEIGLWNIRT
ncbi:hypothetical protein E2C01_009172 [Portunus trituberculatus]|uniref:Uncharacterized protein n=1 Tax=Portunus trituberculatus TaxID=210409 RepID=A0A5B7D3U7_PORTR|nr:hypothetical protein [Portunus trituberculatus]